LRVSQNNLLENKNQVIYDGIAKITKDTTYKISYLEEDKTEVELILNKSMGSLQRIGEVSTLINFNLENAGLCKVTTTFGDLFMDVNTLEIRLENSYIFLYYELLEAGAIVGRFQLRMEWENE
ncbi:MAG TPA: DUF1934 family protein, partial [Erysipelotrichaceae bacterium]|nr:DUF1934 family protein [Erysipelotrichaceae bacterium]